MNFLNDLKDAAVARCPDFGSGLDDWTPLEWGGALAGETGELCNELKKLRRFDLLFGVGSAERRDIICRAANEMGDVLTYLSIIAATLGVDLEDATREKFNAKSEEIGSEVKL